jgi:NADPH-dependent ferric siderophore reductase
MIEYNTTWGPRRDSCPPRTTESRTHLVRHNSRRMRLAVLEKHHVTPKMLRIVLGGEDLQDFVTASADDHIKIYVTGERGDFKGRDFTPRHFDARAKKLTIDIALHPAGPAIHWAEKTQIGDSVEISGPRGSRIIADDFDWWLLIGDETALPSIGRRVEGLAMGVRVFTLVAVTGPAEEQVFNTRADHQAIWVYRSAVDASNPQPLMEALQKINLPSGEGFVWIAAEAKVARAARDHIINVRHHPMQFVRASGYWIKGQADTYDRLEN